jgi:hypothetical protein
LDQHSYRTPSFYSYSFNFPSIEESTLAATTPASTPPTISQTKIFNKVGITKNPIQNTSDCTVSKGCFLYPSKCEGTSCKFIYKYSSDENFIHFELSAKVGSLSKPWLAIGMKYFIKIKNDSCFFCLF